MLSKNKKGMSDIVWILILIVAWKFVIAPLFKGVASSSQNAQRQQDNKNSGEQKSDKSAQGDYVDYEEIK